jgi:PilZ domain-containing protein
MGKLQEFPVTLAAARASLEHSRTWTEQRGPRFKVLMKARMRAGQAPVDVYIRDVSERGMLLQSAMPPAPGTFVEILDLAELIVGRVEWRSGRKFGISLGQRCDITRLFDGPANSRIGDGPRPAKLVGSGGSKPIRDSELSRAWGAMLQFAFLVIAGIAAAALLADVAYERLSAATLAVTSAIEAGPR